MKKKRQKRMDNNERNTLEQNPDDINTIRADQNTTPNHASNQNTENNPEFIQNEEEPRRRNSSATETQIFIETLLDELVREQNIFYIADMDEFFIYDPETHIYIRRSKEFFQNYLYKMGGRCGLLPMRNSPIIKNFINRFLDAVKTRCYIESSEFFTIIDQNNRFIVFNNCIYDLYENTFLPFSQNIVKLNKINASFLTIPLSASKIAKEIKKHLCREDYITLLEFFYCVIVNLHLKRAAFCAGKRNTMKTTTFEILKNYIPVTTSSISAFNERFTDSLFSKFNLVIFDELNLFSFNEKNISLIKGRINIKREIWAEFKNVKQSIKLPSYPLFAFLTNTAPYESYMAQLISRFLVIEFTNKIIDEDPNFILSLTEKDYSIFLCEIINAGKRLKKDKYIFYNEKETDQNTKILRYRRLVDSIFAFVYNCVAALSEEELKDEEGNIHETKITITDLYEAYVDYCRENEIGEIRSKTTFRKKIFNCLEDACNNRIIAEKDENGRYIFKNLDIDVISLSETNENNRRTA